MILPARQQNRQAAACSRIRSDVIFSHPSEPGRLLAEAHPSSKHRASVCQNRYPSPSRRSGPKNRVRPSLLRISGRSPAEIGCRAENSLAMARPAVVPAHRVCANDPEGGRQTCRKQYHSYSSQRCLGFQLVTKAAILNAQFWARRSAVPQAKYSMTANVSPVQQLAVPQAHWLTTSDLAAPEAAFDKGAARQDGRVALFCLGNLPNDMGDAPCSRKS